MASVVPVCQLYLLDETNDELVSRIAHGEDVRSLSRIGRSDLGTNARRIESYLARLKG